jgi:hypothetical protein
MLRRVEGKVETLLADGTAGAGRLGLSDRFPALGVEQLGIETATRGPCEPLGPRSEHDGDEVGRFRGSHGR